MPYTGASKYTNWCALACAASASPFMTSEQVPVVVDGVTTYSVTVDASMDQAWASGFQVFLTFFNAAGTSLGTVGPAVSGAMAAGIHSVVSTTPSVSPAGSSYATVTILLVGAPAATNPLKIYSAKVATGSNTTVPDIVNYNFSFINGTWPWVVTANGSISVVSSPLSHADGNPDSLVIAGIIELMGGEKGSPCRIPDLSDKFGNSATFRISTPGGQLQTLSSAGSGPYDLGDPQPTQDFVESLLLDGERPFGSRTSNRTMSIPVAIYAPSQQTLNAARDYLLSVIDKQHFEITWTPAATGLTTVFDCFRALPSVIMYGFNNLREGVLDSNNHVAAPAIGLVTITIQALPFARSGIDGVVEVDFASGLVNGAPIASAVTLDDFTGTIDTADAWVKNTQYPVLGPDCVFHRNPTPVTSPYPPVIYQRTGLTAVSIVNCPVLAVWVGQSYDSQWPSDPKFTSNVTVSAVLTDANGATVSCKTTVNNMPWNAQSSKPAWKQVSLPIPQRALGFSYNQVTGFKITITNATTSGVAGYVRMNAWLGYVSANPQSITNISSPRGITYNLFGLSGSARAPISAQVQLPNADVVVQEFTQTGFFQVPAGVTSLMAECWGAGGAGSSVGVPIAGGGGGAGEYAMEPALKVTPGTKIPMTTGTGGLGAQVTPTVQSFNTHGVGTTWTCPAGVTSVAVECWGGGAAGAPGGGGGGGGGYASRNFGVTPGTAYAMWVGSGGQPNTGTTSQAQASRSGQNTWFGNPGTKYLANALAGAHGGSSPVAGSAEGGAGGTPVNATTGYTGGTGGRSPGGAGGGGGAAGFTGPGKPGSASPKLGSVGGGDYLTGGPGGSGPGGGGGAGASVPGAAVPGTAPGGAGGGGYTKNTTTSAGTKAVNYQGAAGAPGRIRLTYSVNSGNPVNGTSTIFGSAVTTPVTVTAHGGSSATQNSSNGAAGGSGSSNAVHFPGGTGALAQRNGNGLLTAGANQASLGTGTATAATVTTATSAVTIPSSAIQMGTMLVASVMSSAAPANPVVADSAGNKYYQADTQLLTDGSFLSSFVSTLKFPVVSGSVLTVAYENSISTAAAWGYIAGVRDLEDTAIVSAAGNSATASLARTYPDTSASYYELIIVGNHGSSTSQAGFASSPGAPAFTSAANGTLGLNFACRLTTGSSSAVTMSGALGASMPWALMTLPFVAANQDGQLVATMAHSNFAAATSDVLTNSGPAAVALDAGTGYHVVKVRTTSTPTVTVSDSGGNTYVNLGAAAAGTQKTYLFGAPVTHNLSGAWTVTVALSSSAAASVDTLYLPGGTGVDATGTFGGSGTGTAVSLSYPATTGSGNLQLGVLSYANNGDLATGAPAWTAPASGIKYGTANNTVLPAQDDFYLLQQSGTGTPAFSTTLTSSIAWGMLVISIASPNVSGGGGASGGSGGTGLDGSNGISGGAPGFNSGGKGANGVSGSQAGAIGAVPGGGGSGANETNSGSFQGGSGGNGLIRVTHLPPVIGFNDFILHRPGEFAPADLVPLIPVPVSDPPDNREYPVPQSVAGRNAVFRGTYSVLLCAAAWDSPSVSRRVSVTVNQYEYPGGPAVSVQATRTLAPATDVVNGYVSMGELTLPVKSVSSSNSEAYYTLSIHDTNQNDSFQDIIMLDSQGSTVLCNIAPGTAGDSQYVNYYVDEPGMEHDLGLVLGSSHERDRAISVLDMAMVTGGPLYVAPGDNLLLAYSSKGAPNIAVTYSPRWYSDRIV